MKFSICDKICTLRKVKKIRVISRRSENTFNLLHWLSMRKHILKHKKIKKTFVPKIILHNYILYKGDPTYVAIFPVYVRMDLIFTDFPTGSGSPPCAVLENCHIGQITLIKYNCAILFLGQMSSLFFYVSKYVFS